MLVVIQKTKDAEENVEVEVEYKNGELSIYFSPDFMDMDADLVIIQDGHKIR